MIFGLVRIGLFFGPASSSNGPVKKTYSSKYVAAFIIDWISSAVPTLVGIFIMLFILLILLKILIFCLRLWCDSTSSDSTSSGIIRKLMGNRGVRRFLIMDCNCPCYTARPRLRFQIRFALLFTFFILRITAIGLYATASPNDYDGGTLAIVCALSLIFITNTICLDFYRYWVWWHYTPQNDTRCHLRSRKHERYLPYHMFGKFRDPRTLGNRPCIVQPCHKRTLDHIAIFHSSSYQPQDAWPDIPKPPVDESKTAENSVLSCFKSTEKNSQPHYIGFHRTDPQSAVNIAHSEFQPGSCGWIGSGAYFARSITETHDKAKSEGGAYIIAEVRMGKVCQIKRSRIAKGNPNFDAEDYDYYHHSKWKNDFDTCYMIDDLYTGDEFAIKDPASQIVKRVILIEKPFDPKVEKYGFCEEFDSTECRCI